MGRKSEHQTKPHDLINKFYVHILNLALNNSAMYWEQSLNVLVPHLYNFVVHQEYVPEHDEVTSKLVWEDRLNYVSESEIAT